MAFDETYNEPESTEVLVKSLDPEHPAQLHYAHAGDAGADLITTVDVTLKPFERALVPTGVAIALPAGYVALVPLINLDPKHTAVFHPGDRIAQLVIQRYVEARFIPAETLPGSDRAERGFGSTGVAS